MILEAQPGLGAPLEIQAFVVLLAVLSVVGLVSRRIGLPYSVALVLFGLGVSAVASSISPPIRIDIPPGIVLAALLPGLVFEAAFRIDARLLLRSLGGVALLAVPGVVISAALVAIVLNLATGLPLGLGFVVGAMISATDPAAVIDAAKRIGAPKRLETLFEAESLFNDGTAIVIFLIALQGVLGEVSIAAGVAQFVVVVLLSVAIGFGTGMAVNLVLTRSEAHLIEITLSIFLAYGTYVLADVLHLSGIIATVTAGIVLGGVGRRYGLSQRASEVIDDIWEFLAFLLTGVVFLLIGLAMTIDRLAAAALPIAWAVVAILAGRALVVYGLLGGGSVLLARAGGGALGGREAREVREVGLPLGWLHVIFWGGLRGAVAVALALALPTDFPQRTLLQGLTFGVVLFTLIVQGTTAGRVLHWAGVTHEHEAPAG